VRVNLQLGAELDVLTKDEARAALDGALANWQAEFARGRRYRRFSAQAAVVGGAITIGPGVDGDGLGPDEGFVWSVKRLTVSGFSAANDTVDLFLNDRSGTTLVEPGIARAGSSTGGVRKWGSNQLVLQAGDRLLISGAGLAVETTRIVVAGQTLEAPAALIWSL
jgi:hypothetical protein